MTHKARFLTLGQHLVGQEAKLKTTTPHTIYRAGQAPDWLPKDDNGNDSDTDNSDADNDRLPSSYVVSTTLEKGQQPTFVDVLRGISDHNGYRITKRDVDGNHAYNDRDNDNDNHSNTNNTDIHNTYAGAFINHDNDDNHDNDSLNEAADVADVAVAAVVSDDDFDFDLENMEVPETQAITNIDNKNHIQSVANADPETIPIPNEWKPTQQTLKLKEEENHTDAIHTSRATAKIEQQNEIKNENILAAKDEGITQITNNTDSNHIGGDDDDGDEDESDSSASASSSSSSSSSSEYETDSESDAGQTGDRFKNKLVFLSAAKRQELYEQMAQEKKNKNKNKSKSNNIDTNTNMLTMDEEYELIEEDSKRRAKELEIEARAEVIDYVRKMEMEEKENLEKDGNYSDRSMPDDNDEYSDEDRLNAAIKKWQLRELKRYQRDEEIRESIEKEETILQQRRKMDDSQIMADNLRLGIKQRKPKNKKGSGNKMKFLQKYYHSGVFYRDNSIVDEQILQQNFLAPTGKDKWINYENVPKPMQRKDFGKMSQTKWTHLVNEDTTQYSKDYKFRHYGKRRENQRVIQRGGEGAVHPHSAKSKTHDRKRDTFRDRDEYKPHRSRKSRRYQ